MFSYTFPMETICGPRGRADIYKLSAPSSPVGGLKELERTRLRTAKDYTMAAVPGKAQWDGEAASQNVKSRDACTRFTRQPSAVSWSVSFEEGKIHRMSVLELRVRNTKTPSI